MKKKTLTKIISITIAVVMLFSCVQLCSVAYDYTDFEYAVISDETTGEPIELHITKYNGSDPILVIPYVDTVTYQGVDYEVPVTEIGDNAFKGNTTLEALLIDNNIYKIGNSAFEGCTNLVLVVFSSYLTEIGNSAFFNCTSLQEVVFPEGLLTIGNLAFANNSSLQSVYLPKTLTSIASDAFSSINNEAIFLVYPNTNASTFALNNNYSCVDPRTVIQSLEVDNFNLNPIYGYNDAFDWSQTEVYLNTYNGEQSLMFFNYRVDSINNTNEFIISFEYYGFTKTFKTFLLPEETDFVYGDLNNDDNFSIVDAKLILDSIVENNESLTPEEFMAADLSGDGNVSIIDAKLLLQRIAYSA